MFRNSRLAAFGSKLTTWTRFVARADRVQVMSYELKAPSCESGSVVAAGVLNSMYVQPRAGP